MAKRVWITWEIQRRNRTMSARLCADLYEIITIGSRWKRYPILILRTLKIIFKTRPSLLFVQNPSLLLAAISVLYGRISSTIIIVDAHNAGIFPLEGKSRILNKLAKVINSHADKIIVTNTALKKFINKTKDDVFVIPDPIPYISQHSGFPFSQDKFNLVFICSWATDEPYEEVLSMAENVSDIANIYITGNSGNKEKSVSGSVPKNIILTGFLSDHDYEDLLVDCDAVMILTKRNNCLLCGAYEGVAVEKPMVLSKTNALVEYFNKGCVYSDNSSADIENSIRVLINTYDDLVLEIKSLKNEQEYKTNLATNEFNNLFV